jgi:putative ABC transport system ATP-binding protein
LNLIAGLDRPDAGAVVDGVDVAALSDDDPAVAPQRIGFVFRPSCSAVLNVEQNVALPLTLNESAEAHTATQACWKPWGWVTAAEACPELSGGELQRVAIARALIHRPAWCWPANRLATRSR